ncbi:MAG: glycosyltransferase family 4 protein [Bryobacteraceae bacterium]
MSPGVGSHRPIDIALVIDTLARGGAERILVSIANELDRRRFRVHVIETRESGDFVRELAPDVARHSLGRRTRWDIMAVRRLAALLRQNEIQVVHTHSHTAAYLMRIVGFLTRRRWVHVMHDHHGPVDESILRWSDRWLLRKVDHYFAVSEPLRRYAADWVRIPEGRCERLANGVPVYKSVEAPKSGTFTIAHVGRLCREKNHEMALAVAALLRRDLPVFRWLMIGRMSSVSGQSCRESARRMGLEDHVVFLGERDDVADLLAGAHVGVLTSRYEGLPLALLEYMAARLPVVVTDAGDCGATIRSSSGGVVVSCEDVDGFASALLGFAADPSAAERAGEANYRYVREHYNSDAMVRRVAQVYDALLSRAP